MATWKLKIQGIDNNITFNEKTVVGGLGKAKLVSLNIQKEVYAPGYIEAELQIEKGTGEFGQIDFASLLEKTVTVNDGSQDVAKDYIIFECLPEYKPSGDSTSFYLTLSIYSPEYCLTLKKENKCYVAEKLADGVFKSIVSDYKDKIKNINYGKLQRLIIPNKRFEFIQPYLVQYEETAFDFLTRIANLHGEFLSYESGVWEMGFCETPIHEDAKAAINTNQYTTLSFNKLTSKDDAEETFYGMKEDYLETFTESDFDYPKELAKRTGFNSFQGWLFNVGNWAKKANIAEIVTGVAADTTKNYFKAIKKGLDSEDEWNKVHVEPFKDNPEQCYTVDGKIVVCPFSNYNAKSYFGKKFYQDVRKAEKKVSREKIHINFGTNYVSFLLHNRFDILGGNYIVTKISTSCKWLDATNATYTTLEIDAIPLYEGVVYPPLLEKKHTRKIENQMAFVTANDDPSSLGRIQIRYPWQTDNGKPFSPWLPVMQPFASNNAAIKFTPQVGDAIMIGYEHGEIERPFMIGALASKTNKLSSVENLIASVENTTPNTKYNNDFVIKSPNGHYLKFMSPDKESGVLKSFSPAVKSWLGYLPGNWDIITDNVNCDRNLNGGISLGDAYGFVNINMSTDKRKVFISSAMGDVQIDAFTGITISAPNGNVKIEGKNVEIVAGNNLTLKSGENVDKMRKFYKKDWNIMGSGIANAAKKTVLSEIKKHVQIVDLTLLRTFIDAVVKPIGGTMLIKSKRFMRLEAGKGSTSLPKQAYQKGSDKQKKIYDAKCDEMYVNDTVMSALNLMKWYEDTYNKTVRKLKVLEKDLHDQRAIFFRSIWAFEAKKGVVKFNGKKRGELAEIVDKQNDIIDAAKADNVDQAKIHPKLDKITFEKENLGVQEHIRLKASLEEFKATAERLAKEISEYTSSIKKMQDPNNEKLKAEIISISDKENRIFEEAMIKDTICHYLEIPGANGTPSPKKRISTLTDNIFTFKNSKEKWISPEEKRQIIYYVLNALKEQNKVTIKNESDKNTAFLDHKQNLSTLDVSVCEDPQTWKDYLDCVKPYEKGTSTEDKISSFLSEYVLGGSLEHWSENFLYDPEIEGEILLSDTGGNTCKINGETISSIPTSSIKAAIGILKNI